MNANIKKTFSVDPTKVVLYPGGVFDGDAINFGTTALGQWHNFINVEGECNVQNIICMSTSVSSSMKLFPMQEFLHLSIWIIIILDVLNAWWKINLFTKIVMFCIIYLVHTVVRS